MAVMTLMSGSLANVGIMVNYNNSDIHSPML